MRLITQGTPLGVSTWTRRHQVLVAILTGLLPIVVAIGLLQGIETGHLLNELLILCMFTALAASGRVSRPLRSLLCVLGYLVGAFVLIDLSAGSTAAHLSLYLVVGLIGLYEDVVLHAVAAVYLGLVYGLIAGAAPEMLSGALGDGAGGWWPHLVALWAAIAIWLTVQQVSMRERNRSQQLAGALGMATAARQQATEVHDSILQSVSAAQYALEMGETELAQEAITQAVAQTKAIVDRLNDTAWVDLEDRLRRLA